MTQGIHSSGRDRSLCKYLLPAPRAAADDELADGAGRRRRYTQPQVQPQLGELLIRINSRDLLQDFTAGLHSTER